MKKFVVLCGLCFFFICKSVAQITVSGKTLPLLTSRSDSTDLQVRNIIISGNKKTKKYVIERELPFRVGSYIPAPQILQYLELTRERLMNTLLFLDVLPNLKNWNERKIDIVIDVKERWYIFPIPYFKLIDRNFNQWWKEQKRDLNRVNYGIKFIWSNVTGRNDKLNIYLVNGYNRQYSFYYEQPYADKHLNKGYVLGAYYVQSRQLSFATDRNKQVFYPDSNHFNGFERKMIRFEAGYSYRKGVRFRHIAKLAYTDEEVSDTVSTIIEQNSGKGYRDYFTGGKIHQRFPELQYTFQYYNADYIPYPLNGFIGRLDFTQRGLGLSKGMNLCQLDLKAGYYHELFKKTYFGVVGGGQLKLPFSQPYYNLQSMGYKDYNLRAMEYYVIDGVASFLVKNTIRRKIFDFSVPTYLKNREHDRIPFKIFIKAFGDFGYNYNPSPGTSILNNKLLYSGGFGMDILTFYDFQFRFEYGINQLGEKGLFLHTQKEF